MRQIPSPDLIAPDFVNFTRPIVLQDGVLDIALYRGGGPTTVGGGEFGSQQIQSLPMDVDFQNYLQNSFARLDRLIDLDFRVISDPQLADAVVYLDSEINLGDGGVTLGIALSNSEQLRDWWELILNGPALSSDESYLRYAAIHEFGHSIGLEHPFDSTDGDTFAGSDPSQSAYPEETVMAYRDPQAGGAWPEWYSDNDIAALISIWGAELQPLSDGADQVSGRGYRERFDGLRGNDNLAGGAGDDELIGGQDQDRLYGNQGDDWLHGGQGNDWLHGGQGKDWLTGGLGADRLIGGLGPDRFRVSAGDDWIEDFSLADGDRLEIPVALGYQLEASGSDVLIRHSQGLTHLIGANASGFNASAIVLV